MILALETSEGLGSVAVGAAEEGTGVVARRFLRRQRAHAARLVPAVVEVLEEAEIDRRDLEGVVVGAGPGSFTGVRVAAATAKGLVRALGIPLWATSSLEAGAAAADLGVPELEGASLPAGLRERPRCVLFDARAERVYAGCYRVREEEIETLRPPWPTRIAPLLEGLGRDLPEESLFCGTGAVRHREAIEEAGGEVIGEPVGTPTADGLLRVRALDPERVSVSDPGRWEPEYVRPWRSG